MIKVKAVSIALILLFLVIKAASTAEIKADVTMRSSKHEGVTRLVFEAVDDEFIKNTSVTQSQNQLKVNFPSGYNLRSQGNLNLDTSAGDKTLVININNPFKIKVLRLFSPSRLSIDIITSESPAIIDQKTIPVVSGMTSGLRIVIDAGHGGYDNGLLSGDLREKDLTLSMARDMESAMARKVKALFLTRRSDQFLTFRDRALFTNQKSPDIFISLHLSVSDNFVIYTVSSETPRTDLSVIERHSLMSRQMRYIEKSRALGVAIGGVIKDEFKKEIIYREMPLPLLNSIEAPAVMVELPKTAIYDAASRTGLSNAILKGIALYAGQ